MQGQLRRILLEQSLIHPQLHTMRQEELVFLSVLMMFGAPKLHCHLHFVIMVNPTQRAKLVRMDPSNLVRMLQPVNRGHLLPLVRQLR